MGSGYGFLTPALQSQHTPHHRLVGASATKTRPVYPNLKNQPDAKRTTTNAAAEIVWGRVPKFTQPFQVRLVVLRRRVALHLLIGRHQLLFRALQHRSQRFNLRPSHP